MDHNWLLLHIVLDRIYIRLLGVDIGYILR